MKLILLMAIIVFFGLDTAAYALARYPERRGHWWSLAPGGGFFALWRYGRNRRTHPARPSSTEGADDPR